MPPTDSKKVASRDSGSGCGEVMGLSQVGSGTDYRMSQDEIACMAWASEGNPHVSPVDHELLRTTVRKGGRPS